MTRAAWIAASMLTVRDWPASTGSLGRWRSARPRAARRHRRLFGTRYGVVWLAAFCVGVFLALWSHLVLARQARRQTAMPPSAMTAGAAVAVRPDPMPRIVEMVGFFVLFTLMIVLKFS